MEKIPLSPQEAIEPHIGDQIGDVLDELRDSLKNKNIPSGTDLERWSGYLLLLSDTEPRTVRPAEIWGEEKRRAAVAAVGRDIQTLLDSGRRPARSDVVEWEYRLKSLRDRNSEFLNEKYERIVKPPIKND
jgi:hypothetical protein